MSKQVKQMIMDEYARRFAGYDDAVLVSLRGVDANATNAIRQGLAQKEIRLTVVRNNLAKKSFEGTGLEGLTPLLEGPSTLAYGAESVVEVAREIVDLVKQFPDIELKGAILDGELFEGEDGIKRLSSFPTRDEAIAQDVTLILGPGRTLMGQVKGPGSRLAGIIKTIRDKLEKGEEIAKVG